MRVHAHHPKSLWLKILPITPYYSRILMLSVPQLHCFHRPGGRGVPPHCRIHESVHDHRKASDKNGLGRQWRGRSCKIAEASTAMTFLPGTLTRAASAFIPPRAVGSLVGYSQISDQRPSLCLRQNSVRRRDGEDCKDSRPQKSDGYLEEHGLSQVRQAHADRQASERPRAERAGRSLYFLLRLRFLREAVSFWRNAVLKEPKSRFLGAEARSE